MTDVERLTQLVCECLQTDECIAHCNYGPCCTCTRLANYLATSGCKPLPWKINDIIYYINPRTKKIETDTVIRLTITQAGCNPILAKHKTSFWKHYQWFRTEWEARNYLKNKKELENE